MDKDQGNKVLVFGTFDGVHDGHLFFLSEAKKHGALHISVASNESVNQRKGRLPKKDLAERIKDIEALGLAESVLPGDKTLNEWSAIKIVKPHIIAVGFDQFGLKTALKDIAGKFGFEIKLINQLS